MDNVETFKKIAKIVVCIGVGMVVNNIVKSTTPISTSTINKTLVGIGSFVIGGMISELAAKYTEEGIDAIVNEVKTETKTA